MYSRYFLDELDDEIQKHITLYDKYFDIFRSIGVLQFEKQDFLKAFEDRKSEFLPEVNPNELLKSLFEFSIIGYYRVGGSGYGGSEYTYKYLHELATFDTRAKKLKIHPALMEYLQLKKYIKSSTPE